MRCDDELDAAGCWPNVRSKMKSIPLRLHVLFLCVLFATSSFSQDVPENKYFDSDGTRIRYIETGDGVPVIALHGFTMDSNSMLNRFSDLAKNHRLILFDLRGHGLSDKPHTVAGYGREMGHDVIRLMDHLNISKAHLLGYSLGVVPIPMVITENESRFISVVFVGGAARWEWGEDLDRLYQGRYEKLMRTTPQELLDRGLEGQDPVALANLRLGQKQLIVSKQSLSDLKIPILAIVGSEDPALEEVQNFKTTFPKLELNVMEGQTHRSVIQHPKFIERVQAFFSSTQEN